jgi:hypothetical protein
MPEQSIRRNRDPRLAWRGHEGTPKGESFNIAAPLSDSPLELAYQAFSD